MQPATVVEAPEAATATALLHCPCCGWRPGLEDTEVVSVPNVIPDAAKEIYKKYGVKLQCEVPEVKSVDPVTAPVEVETIDLPQKRVSLSDIAKELGLSTSAVGLALQDKACMSVATRARVKEAADRLGYKKPAGGRPGKPLPASAPSLAPIPAPASEPVQPEPEPAVKELVPDPDAGRFSPVCLVQAPVQVERPRTQGGLSAWQTKLVKEVNRSLEPLSPSPAASEQPFPRPSLSDVSTYISAAGGEPVDEATIIDDFEQYMGSIGEPTGPVKDRVIKLLTTTGMFERCLSTKQRAWRCRRGK